MIPVPRIRAVSYIQKMPHGRTQPGMFVCRRGNAPRETYIVKYHSQLRTGSLSEFMAALLAERLRVPVPPCAIVDIDPLVVAMVSDPDIRQLLSGDPGPHFGSEFQAGGYKSIPYGFGVPEAMLPEALRIFAFDMLIQNVDRSGKAGQGKPNLLFDGTQFLVYDHEMSFSFVRAIGQVPPPWELRGLPFTESHIFYPQIVQYSRRHQVSFDDFLSDLRTVSDVWLGDLVEALPIEWRDDRMSDKIIAHLVLVRENISRFGNGLLEVLA